MKMIQNIKTEKDLRKMLTEVIGYLGWTFHPDDPMADYIRMDIGEPSYTHEEAERLDYQMDEAFDFCERQGIDIYELSMDICKQLHGNIMAA